MAEVIFNKLEKVYSNGFKAVHGIDLKIADGEFMVIVGPLRLRQIDHPAHAGGPGDHQRGRGADWGQNRQQPGA